MMYDTIIVGLIVAAAAFFAGRFLYKSLNGKTAACNCSAGCPLHGSCGGRPGSKPSPEP